MSTQVYAVNAFKDSSKYQLRVYDDHLEFWPQGRSGASFWFTPIKTQLALQPLVRAAQAAGAIVVPYTDISSYTWYEQYGQINFVPFEGAQFSFHISPARKAREFVDAFHPVWLPHHDYRIALDEYEQERAGAAADADRKARADEIARAVTAALTERESGKRTK